MWRHFRRFWSAAWAAPQFFVVAIQLFRVALLSLYLFASTRLLGPDGYGALTTAVALAAIGATLVGMGSGIGLVRLTSREVSVFPKAWGECLGRHLTSGLLLFFIYLLISDKWLSSTVSVNALLPIGITELLLVPLISTVGYAFIAHAGYRVGALIQSLPAVARLLVAGGLWFHGGGPGVDVFATFTLLAMCLACVLSLLLGLLMLPLPRWPALSAVVSPDYSMAYAGSNLVNSLSGEADKLVVYRLTAADQTGLYSAATRIMAAFAIPFGALIQARSHELFALGPIIGPEHVRFLWRHAIGFAAYGGGCVVIVTLAAPYLAGWLGPGFENGHMLIAGLALWIPLNGFRQLLGTLLTTSDNAWLRSCADIFTALIFIALALVLIPLNGVMGAVEAKLVAELAGLLTTFLIFLRARRADS